MYQPRGRILSLQWILPLPPKSFLPFMDPGQPGAGRWGRGWNSTEYYVRVEGSVSKPLPHPGGLGRGTRETPCPVPRNKMAFDGRPRAVQGRVGAKCLTATFSLQTVHRVCCGEGGSAPGVRPPKALVVARWGRRVRAERPHVGFWPRAGFLKVK